MSPPHPRGLRRGPRETGIGFHSEKAAGIPSAGRRADPRGLS